MFLLKAEIAQKIREFLGNFSPSKNLVFAGELAQQDYFGCGGSCFGCTGGCVASCSGDCSGGCSGCSSCSGGCEGCRGGCR